MNLVYKKALRLSVSARRAATVGEMSNILSVNAQMLADLTTYLNVVWSAPLQIILSLIMLYKYLGISAIIGVGTVILIIPLNIFVVNKIKKIQLTKHKHQDSRIKMMNEILSGIKVLKFYGWELSFKNILSKIRTIEMKNYMKSGLFFIFTNLVWTSAPLIITIVSFGSFIAINDSEMFTSNVVFVSLSLFNILRFPLVILPSIISTMIAAQVSVQRIENFLLNEEINDKDIEHADLGDIAVKASNVDLSWSAKEEPLFKSLNLEIRKGKLVAIVGQVGSGKSSLLCALLGEMHKLNEGRINVNGRVAYVPQQAWIQNETLRNNIISFKNKNNNKTNKDDNFYEQVLSACALTADLNIMPAGDQTEIGEKGINLSGGQKQRVSLARAVYSNADIYMLDDPLSAVDSHVGKYIFDNIIGSNGILSDKTRLFVTNSLRFLPQVDEILMLDNGRIVESGTFDQLSSKKDSQFNNFIKTYLDRNINKEEEKESNEENNLDNSMKNQQKNDSHLSRKISLKIESTVAELKTAMQNASQKKETEGKLVQKERIETGKVKSSTLRAYFRACGTKYFALLMAISFWANVVSVGSNLWLSVWTDSLEKSKNSTFQIWLNYLNHKVSHTNPALFPFIVFSIIGFFQCKIKKF